jgi:DNA-binding beta-propeller fold protein YncE
MTRIASFILVVMVLFVTPLMDSFVSTVEHSFTEQELDHTMRNSVYGTTENTEKQVQLLDNASGHSIGWNPDGMRKEFRINEKDLTDSSVIATTINLVPLSQIRVNANCFDIKGVDFFWVWILDDFCGIGHARLHLLDVRENTIQDSNLVLALGRPGMDWLIGNAGYVCCEEGKLKEVDPSFGPVSGSVRETRVNVVPPFDDFCTGTMSNLHSSVVLIPYSCDSMLYVVDMSAFSFGNVTARIPVGEHPIKVSSDLFGPVIYTLNEGNTSRWVTIENTSPTNGTVSVINSTSNQLMKTIELGRPGPSDMEVDFRNNMVYVSYGEDSKYNGTISVINGTSNQLTDTVQVGKNARELAVNPKTRMFYTVSGDPGNHVISVINGTSNQLTTTISLGERGGRTVLGEMVINPRTNMIYVIDKFSNGDFVAIINGSSNQVLTKVPVGREASDMFISEDHDKVYLKSKREQGPFFTNLSDEWRVNIIDGYTRSILPNNLVNCYVSAIEVSGSFWLKCDDAPSDGAKLNYSVETQP